MNDAGTVVFNLILVFFLVFMNGFFVAAEFAMVRIRTSRISQLVTEGNRKAKVAQQVTDHLDAYLSACQLGITLASLGLGWVGEPAVASLIEKPLLFLHVPEIAIHSISFVIGFAVITFLHIVLGELAPKSLAIHRSEGTVLRAARPLVWFRKVMYPAIWVLNGTANALLRWMGIEPAKEGELAHTEEEIRILVNQSHRSGLIDNTEMFLFDSVFDFTDRIAREIMIPRVDMTVIDLDDSYETVLQTIEQNRHTRYPVSQGDKDHIVGFVHVKDLYLHMSRQHEFSVQDILRKVVTVSEAAEISAVLKQMQKNRTQIAVVIDEYGGTAGLITMEDIMEELVGDIRDEFDVDQQPPIVLTDDGYSVDGLVLIEEINALLVLDIDNEEVDTIGGWMYSVLDRKPEVGVSVRKDPYVFTIEKIDDRRIQRINIKKAV
ncbi:hemolysin family protein [Effusibacillus dendaii]|uniref:hemolysin family protein n=1 Tax=Effusibacillus dendaii TaxID=2743772 RepID=UPI00190CAAFB|nr:hemolysin family protein [Effusibacillus dendaii]